MIVRRMINHSSWVLTTEYRREDSLLYFGERRIEKILSFWRLSSVEERILSSTQDELYVCDAVRIEDSFPAELAVCNT